MRWRFGNFSLTHIISTLTADRSVSWPDKAGTIALTTDIPTTLDELSDTVITNATEDDALRFNGTSFINSPQTMGWTDSWNRMIIAPGVAGVTQLGTTVGATGTASNPTRSTTNAYTEAEKILYTSAATAGSLASIKGSANATNKFWRGNAAGKGGFKIRIPFGLGALQAGNRGFVGFDSATTNPTNIDPLTNTANAKFGAGFNTNTGNYQLIYNTAGSNPTTLDLGADFPINTTSWFVLRIWCAPNASSISYRITNVGTGATTSNTISTNLPAATTFMSPVIWITNNATAAAVAIAFGQIKAEFG